MVKIVIHGRPATKKNSSRIVKFGSRLALIPSKAYKEYESKALEQLADCQYKFVGPIHVQCRYWLADRRRVDLTNLLAASHDVLQKANVIDDDANIMSVDGSIILGVDSKNPRVEIVIERWDGH